jgi:L-alanine-DL-glutamate epimerase-like enolase superfamily enzyme
MNGPDCAGERSSDHEDQSDSQRSCLGFLAIQYLWGSAIWDRVYVEKPAVVDGHIVVPNRPGLGLTIDQDVADSFVSSDWL